jgi:hypothetical protein
MAPQNKTDDPGDPGDDLARRLRDALSPPPEQVARLVRRALAAPEADRARRPRLRRLVPAASLLGLLAAVAVFFSLPSTRPRRDAVVSIVNLDGVVIATSQEEERPLILSGAGAPPSSGIILIRHGGQE